MCSFITQYNATDVASFDGACNWHADSRNVHQSCLPVNLMFLLYHKPSPKTFQRIWQYIQPASQPQTTCNHTSPEPPHPASSPPRSSETSHPDIRCNNRFEKGQFVGSVPSCGWAVLLMSTLWIEWPMVAVGWWYGQAYVMDNDTGAFYWWHFECTVIPWRDSKAHCCAIHPRPSPHVAAWKCTAPMLQGSVHNSWKLKTSQFLHGQHTHRTCHPLSMFGMLWIGVYDSVFQFLPISSNFTQPLKRSGPTFHRPLSTTWSTLCEGDVLHWANGGHTRYWLDFGPPQYSKTAHFRVAFYCGQPKAHLCNNHAGLISILMCHTCEVDGLSRQRRMNEWMMHL